MEYVSIDLHLAWSDSKKAVSLKNIVVYTNEFTENKIDNVMGPVTYNKKSLFNVSGCKSNETVCLVENESGNLALKSLRLSHLDEHSSGEIPGFQPVDPSTEKDGSYLENTFAAELLKTPLPGNFVDELVFEEPKREDFEVEIEFKFANLVYKNNTEKNKAFPPGVSIGNTIKNANIPERNRAIRLHSSAFHLDIDEKLFFERHGFRISSLKSYLDAVLTYLIAYPLDLLRIELENLLYIGPIRSIPDRVSDYSLLPEYAGWADGMAAWKYLYEEADDDFFDFVNDWLAGFNANPGGVVINHGFVHPDYMGAISMNFWGLTTQSLAGRSAPQGNGIGSDSGFGVGANGGAGNAWIRKSNAPVSGVGSCRDFR
jgi:hypothetical protein